MSKKSGIAWDKKFLKKLSDADAMRVKVGVLASKGGAVLHPGSDLTMVQIAAVHEYGAPQAGIPERSFIRSTFERERPQFSKQSAAVTEKYLEGKVSLDGALGILGALAVSEIKKTITSGAGVPPPNAPATVARKKSSRPLVDTGRLLGSLQWEVVRTRGGD